MTAQPPPVKRVPATGAWMCPHCHARHALVKDTPTRASCDNCGQQSSLPPVDLIQEPGRRRINIVDGR